MTTTRHSSTWHRNHINGLLAQLNGYEKLIEVASTIPAMADEVDRYRRLIAEFEPEVDAAMMRAMMDGFGPEDFE